MKNKYFVYLHLFEKKPIYVGCGSLHRAYSKCNRSKVYMEFIKGNNIEVFIYRIFNDKKQAIKCEEIITESIGLENLFNKRVGNSPFGESGKLVSKETRKKISEALKGKKKKRTKKLSEYTRKKMSESRKGNTYAKGTFRSKELRNKISESLKKHWKNKKLENEK